ncbi:oxygen-independent coproporphyrinogen III oxidase [Alteromonas halophila]|uniref:Coproporphyrinogen-III oxidase n=1 Tax=Alteromonas halophila TaxID=516698 RepID=A0A918JNP7_9ALTE|nr:oxygen-independent coproporphyrinogen III oxidase [Alteromonas halophila]GGW89636.1 coproporphyrinogen-III oxidase [Alteromonas halophila]
MTQPDYFATSLLRKYNINGPRYTSYPTALEFTGNCPPDLLSQAAQASGRDLSLYVHLPFCHSLCYYCGCSKIITRHQDKADEYLDYLTKEARQQRHIGQHRPVRQLHLGGGSPSFLTSEQHTRLIAILQENFTFSDDAVLSIELDPRNVTKAYIRCLQKLGYTRASFGVQDVNYNVQQAINRVQSTQHIAELTEHARASGFTSINLDLIYGLPHQNCETFATTLAAAKALRPDRISLFSYAHLPERFAAQRKIKDEWLPPAPLKLALMKQAISSLTDAGYVMIGMDHFALPEDDLAIARDKGQLHRNFQGYTTGNELDLLGLGVTAISAVGNAYGQNPKQLKDYYLALDHGKPVISKGVALSKDDELRRAIIMSLMCNLHLDIEELETRFNVDFFRYFQDELQQFDRFVKDGIARIDRHQITISEHARLIIRVICMSFDAYLSHTHKMMRYSRVI